MWNLPRMKQPPGDAGPDARLLTMRVLWACFLVNVGLFALVGHLARADSDATDGGGGARGPTLLYLLAAVALGSVIISFVVKAACYRRAVGRRRPAQLQTGFIVALALCEAAPLLGLVGLFVTRNEYAYLLFALGALGTALHFPRREQVESAYYRPVG